MQIQMQLHINSTSLYSVYKWNTLHWADCICQQPRTESDLTFPEMVFYNFFCLNYAFYT